MRLVTRGEFDGLACAAILARPERIESVALIHPQDVTDGRADIRAGDSVVNLPYHPNCTLRFDHHMADAEQQVRMIVGELKANG